MTGFVAAKSSACASTALGARRPATVPAGKTASSHTTRPGSGSQGTAHFLVNWRSQLTRPAWITKVIGPSTASDADRIGPPRTQPRSTLSQPARRRNPWWILPIFGRVPELEPRLLTLLGFVSLALLFESYDYSLLSSALKQIAEDLDIPETHLGLFTALIRLGALPAFPLIPLADRLGRRRLFLAGVLGLGLGTFATAFSQNEWQFVVCQVVSRTSMLLASALAFVFITEEFPAEHRGWGMGMLAAISSIGHGLGALLFALIDVLPYGWRALYVIGVAPVLLLPMFREGIKETARFARHNAQRTDAAEGWLTPFVRLMKHYPARGLGVLAIGMLASFGQAVVFAFIGYFVQEVHGWEPWQYSVMVIVCGAVGVVGNVIGGRMADRYGRRMVGFAVMGLFPLFSWIFFRGPGWLLPIVWILLVFAALATSVVTRALSTELFPTDQRGTSAGAFVLAETLGAGAGLIALWAVTNEPGDLVAMLPAVTSITFFAGLIALTLPETSRRELEVISGDE